jgi:hypothetical protein
MGYIGVPTVTDPEVLSTSAINYLVTNIPGFSPSDGNLEVWQIMALAQMLATSRDVASITPDMIFEYFGNTIMNIPAIVAAVASVSATITVQDTVGYTIPAGTQFAFQVTGTTLAIFAVMTAAVVAPGSASVTNVTLTALTPGVASNGLTGTMVTVDPLAFITGVIATTVSSGGVDAEDAPTYLSRLVSDLQLLAPRPILPNDFAVLTRSVAGVFRALGVDGYNSPRTFVDGVTNTDNTLTSSTAAFVTADVGRGVSGAGIFAGSTIATYISATEVTLSHVTTATATGITITLAEMTGQARTVGVSAVDSTGTVVSSTIQTALIAYLTAMREVNFIISFIQPTVTTINITYSIHLTVDANSSVVEASVLSVLVSYLSEANWGGGANNPPSWDATAGTVRYLAVAGLIESVTGVSYLSALSLNGGGAGVDVVIAGTAPLANLGTVTPTIV